MTDVEQKALALVNEVAKECWQRPEEPYSFQIFEALCCAIEQHEAFRQKVSGMVEAYIKHAFTVQEKHLTGYKVTVGFENHDDAIAWFDQLLFLPEFIIPAPKPDPLVAAMKEAGWGDAYIKNSAPSLRAGLEVLGLEIREKNDDQ